MYMHEHPFQWSTQTSQILADSYDRPDFIDKSIRNVEGKSRLRSPIPPDPGYGDEIRPFSAPCGTGRVVRLHGADAKAIYKRAIANDGAPFQLNVHCKSMLHQNQQTTKNYLNENVKRIRRIMRENQKRQVEKPRTQPIPAKALWHSKQYDHVQSKVKQTLEENKQRSSSRPRSAQGKYLHAHANTGPQLLRSQSVTDLRRNSTQKDFVKINSQYVKQIPQVQKSISAEAEKQALEKQENDLKKYQEQKNGRVPNYIEKIKEKRDQALTEAILNAPDPECPPGHIKVDDKQRVSTLKQLILNRTELEKKLGHLPIRNDSLTIKQTKEQIEKKIVELDEAIEIFSKPKVFIQIDE